jgi:4-hydroxyphenylpyruvate dioxygenase
VQSLTWFKIFQNRRLFLKAMDIDHVHFYVEDAKGWRDWFIHTLNFQSLSAAISQHTHTEVIGLGKIRFVLSSARTGDSPVAQYLWLHPPGIVDVAFRVAHLEAVLDRALTHGMQLLQPMQVQPMQVRSCSTNATDSINTRETEQSFSRWHPGGKEVALLSQRTLKWAQVKGWGELNHTLIEGADLLFLLPKLSGTTQDSEPLIMNDWTITTPNSVFTSIDHVVLNVAAGDLEPAVNWYEQTLGFQRQQAFAIQTERSALWSQVLKHPSGTVQLPINEPASTHSQIQEFLDLNQGSGVQHIALQTIDLVQTIAQLRQQGLAFLQVPETYYDQLRQRPGFCLSESTWQAVLAQEVLVALLLQAFTQPIFSQPTFFFELIERQSYQINYQDRQVQGFGAGNFKALFEAIEREQVKRGSLC